MVNAMVLMISITLSMFGDGLSEPSQTEKAQARLYTVLHNLALPNFDPNRDVVERFILLIPGEVLDFEDYCPLSEKAQISQEYDRLPPDENLFRLSDTVPTLNPLGGGTTGKSLARIYEDVLYSLDTDKLTDAFQQEGYKSAIEWLTTAVEDQLGKELPNITRYELYHRYQKEYFDTKQMVKTWFAGNRSSIDDLQKYEIWYDENYDTLTAYSTSSYTRWMISGLKGPVEDKIASVDIKSLSQEVEEARRALEVEERMGGRNTTPYTLFLQTGTASLN